MPVGLVTPAPMLQVSMSVPDIEYLNTFGILATFPDALSSTTQNAVPSVTMSLASTFGLFGLVFRLKLLDAFLLPDMRLAAPAYSNTLSDLPSTIQTSLPETVIPSTAA